MIQPTRERVRLIIAEIGAPLDLLDAEIRLVGDLGFDSRDIDELACDIKEAFGLEIDPGDWRTVGDVYESVELAVGAESSRG